MANVLKIKKALTNSEIAAKPSKTLPKMSMTSLIEPEISLAACTPVITSIDSGNISSMDA